MGWESQIFLAAEHGAYFAGMELGQSEQQVCSHPPVQGSGLLWFLSHCVRAL